jgi:hypothetical protein
MHIQLKEHCKAALNTRYGCKEEIEKETARQSSAPFLSSERLTRGKSKERGGKRFKVNESATMTACRISSVSLIPKNSFLVIRQRQLLLIAKQLICHCFHLNIL